MLRPDRADAHPSLSELVPDQQQRFSGRWVHLVRQRDRPGDLLIARKASLHHSNNAETTLIWQWHGEHGLIGRIDLLAGCHNHAIEADRTSCKFAPGAKCQCRRGPKDGKSTRHYLSHDTSQRGGRSACPKFSRFAGSDTSS
jgi:hypothetical protein